MEQLSRLYRALVWEGFILHAVAVDEIGGPQKGSGPMDLTPSGGLESTDVQESSSSSGSLLVTLGNVGGRVTSSAQQEQPQVPCTLATKPSEAVPVAPMLSQTLHPLLLSITSRVGHSLAELMSLLVRMSTGTLHRPQRRGVGVSLPAYHPPSVEAMAICQEATELLVSNLRWEVPSPRTPSLSPACLWLFSG